MPLVSGRTRLMGLIGWPIEHTISPAMHNAAFAALGVDACYLPLPVAPGMVEAAVRGLVALGFVGANVTTPHKEAVIPYLDVLTPVGRALGAVNTLVVHRDGAEVRVEGTNTDAEGFLCALREAGFDPRGRGALVVGAGGAARAVVYALAEAGVGRVMVLNRSVDRARRLVDDLAAHVSTALDALPLSSDTLVDLAREVDLLVNATSVGMWPNVERSIWPEGVPMPAGLVVYDLVYTPRPTRLLEQARAGGALPVDGLGMLVYQGALAFERWTGERAPVEVMRQACERELARQGK